MKLPPQHLVESAQAIEKWFLEQGCTNWELCGIRSRALSESDAMNLAGVSVDELHQFVYRMTMQLQKHESLSRHQKDMLFQEAYQLYVKVNADRFDLNYASRMKACEIHNLSKCCGAKIVGVPTGHNYGVVDVCEKCGK